MAKDKQVNAKYLQWQIPEYRVPKRGKNWYIIAGILLFFLIFSSFFTIKNWHLVFLGAQSNILLPIILIMSAVIMFVNEKNPPQMVTIKLGPDGVTVGKKFYSYSEFKNFSVLYKPRESIKKLYFEFENSARFRLSIPLRSMDALTVNVFLAKYLEEDFERENEPLSEQLTKLLKL